MNGFRPATTEDEELFWLWRRRNETDGRVGGWWRHPFTARADHHDWFVERLGKITMLVWYFDGEPAGVVRIDSNGEVAFDATHPRSMLEELLPLAAEYGGRLKAIIDEDDRIAGAALAAAGFREHPVRFYTYRP